MVRGGARAAEERRRSPAPEMGPEATKAEVDRAAREHRRSGVRPVVEGGVIARIKADAE